MIPGTCPNIACASSAVASRQVSLVLSDMYAMFCMHCGLTGPGAPDTRSATVRWNNLPRMQIGPPENVVNELLFALSHLDTRPRNDAAIRKAIKYALGAVYAVSESASEDVIDVRGKGIELLKRALKEAESE